ncbi:MAG: hypothetical protein ABIH99_01350 [Candidatus Micrarchaeota archaeon]
MKLRLLLALFLLAAIANAAFRLESLDVVISVNTDGSAHVSENIVIAINTTDSIAIYDAIMATTNDISSWKRRTGMSEIRQHFDSSLVTLKNVKVTPQPRDTCGAYVANCYSILKNYGMLKIEYDVYPVIEANGSVKRGSGLFKVEQYKPRTINYTLNQKALSFETYENENFLPAGITLTMRLPPDAIITQLSPTPQPNEELEFPIKEKTFLKWNGPRSLGGLEIAFQRRESLASEITDFFRDWQAITMKFIYSSEGIAAIAIAVVALISAFVLRRNLKTE